MIDDLTRTDGDAWQNLVKQMTSGGGYTVASGQPAVKLDANENAYGLPEAFYRDWLAKLENLQLHRYPRAEWTAELRRRVARYAGVDERQVVLGNGSDELIQALFSMLHRLKARVVIPEPTFGFYESAAEAEGIEPIYVPLGPEFLPDWEEWHSFLSDESRPWQAVILCRPNNPTGTVWPEHEVLEMLRLPRTLVVIDEAYWEFAGENLVRHLESGNLFILRTFSKALGLAGMRIGYALSSAANAQAWQKMIQPYNLDVAALWAATIRFDHLEDVREKVELLRQGRDWLAAELSRLPLRILPSGGNFLLFEVLENPAGLTAVELQKKLFQQGIGVRHFPWDPQLRDYLRVTVGTPAENEQFLHQLKMVLLSGGGNEVAQSGSQQKDS